MSKRLTDREKLLHKLQQMTDLELKDVLSYISLLERNKRLPSPNSDDELLTLLSSAYENRRACQVFEWEATRRKSEIKTGSYAR